MPTTKQQTLKFLMYKELFESGLPKEKLKKLKQRYETRRLISKKPSSAPDEGWDMMIAFVERLKSHFGFDTNGEALLFVMSNIIHYQYSLPFLSSLPHIQKEREKQQTFLDQENLDFRYDEYFAVKSLKEQMLFELQAISNDISLALDSDLKD